MSSGNIVKLNVGGTIFQTAKSTLTKFDGFFKTMLETDVPLEKDENGAIFIDRSSKHFDSILNYMRDGEMELPDSEKERKEIMKEAQYYLLNGLMQLLEQQQLVNQYTVKQVKKCEIQHIGDGFDDSVKAISKSEKKTVIIVFYLCTDAGHAASEIKLLHKKFSPRVDIYFSQAKTVCSASYWKFYVYNERFGRQVANSDAELDRIIGMMPTSELC